VYQQKLKTCTVTSSTLRINKIQVLPETVANQIAAGEVVERPVSIVKELVENSLDAGATQIKVEIHHGGKSLIRITDNGSGMSPDDTLLSLERHATSKITDAKDLYSIRSFGFRGEALPSIASISRFRMVTCEPNSPLGTEVLVDGGKIIRVNEAGTPPGTMIEIRSLFANVPARRKFLKSDQTEWAHIDQFLQSVALSNIKLDLSVMNNETNIRHYLPASTLQKRISHVLGASWNDESIPIEYTKGKFKLSGVISKPGISRSNRQEQYIFVNGRPVHNQTIHFGILEGYINSLLKGRYTIAVLFFELPPEDVDVNVHPAKKEVRFREEHLIRTFFAEAISSTLKQLNSTASAPSPITTSSPTPPPQISETLTLSSSEEEKKLPTFITSSQSITENSTPSNSPTQITHDLRIVGTILNQYIITESRQGLVLIDQRAAHERILFEQMLYRISQNEVLSQSLLLPVTLKLQPTEADFLRLQIESLHKLGLSIHEMGGDTFMIDAIPPIVTTDNIEDFFRGILTDLQLAGGETKKLRRLSEETVVQTVCNRAIFSSRPLKYEEMEKLLNDLHACELPYTCPDGRPTMIMLSRGDLEKKFSKNF
jgi:DNA mismatch repair protein MutL